MTTCRLINYILDVVPYVPLDAPPAFQYSALASAEIILPSAAQAEVRFDVVCDHNVICYCAMIDYADTKARASAQDAASWHCIVGPPAFTQPGADARARDGGLGPRWSAERHREAG